MRIPRERHVSDHPQRRHACVGAEALPHQLVDVLAPERSERLRAAARAHGVTLNSLLTGAFGLLLGAWTGRGDAVFGITSSGRDLAGVDVGDTSEIVGVLLNTVPVRTSARPGDTVGAFLAAVQDERTAAMEHDHLGLGELQRAAGHDRLFDTLFVLQNFLDDDTFTALNAEHGIVEHAAEDAPGAVRTCHHHTPPG